MTLKEVERLDAAVKKLRGGELTKKICSSRKRGTDALRCTDKFFGRMGPARRKFVGDCITSRSREEVAEW